MRWMRGRWGGWLGGRRWRVDGEGWGIDDLLMPVPLFFFSGLGFVVWSMPGTRSSFGDVVGKDHDFSVWGRIFSSFFPFFSSLEIRSICWRLEMNLNRNLRNSAQDTIKVEDKTGASLLNSQHHWLYFQVCSRDLSCPAVHLRVQEDPNR